MIPVLALIPLKACDVAVDWNSVDWDVLERLRDRFLDRAEAGGPYWNDARDLANYDFTFGRRIAWKWAAVLEPLFRRGWQPPARRLIDWGCGTGIAARSLLAYAPQGTLNEVVLWDHSPGATTFAADRIAAKYPDVTVQVAEPSVLTPANESFILVVSHVLNELDDDARETLLNLAGQAAAVIWIEPGTHDDSRALIAVRETLRAGFHCLAPCPHNDTCGMLTPENERHWCHHFAQPPTEVFTNAGWGRFSRQLGIDLRRLPYSHFVLDRRPPGELIGTNRIIGEPRTSSGLMRILRCHATGVQEVELQRRDSPALWKAIIKGGHADPFAWTESTGRITSWHRK